MYETEIKLLPENHPHYPSGYRWYFQVADATYYHKHREDAVASLAKLEKRLGSGILSTGQENEAKQRRRRGGLDL